MKTFLAASRKFGAGAEVPYCVYGMAEATLAATFPFPGSGITLDSVDRDCLERDKLAMPLENGSRRSAVQVPILGAPVTGVTVRIADDDANELPERSVGEIELRGPSLFSHFTTTQCDRRSLEKRLVPHRRPRLFGWS